METLKEILLLIQDHGITAVILAALLVLAYIRRDWLISTLQAAAIVKQHEETISELRAEIQEMRMKLEEYNKILIEQASTIARLEERVLHAAKSRVSGRRPKKVTSNED